MCRGYKSVGVITHAHRERVSPNTLFFNVSKTEPSKSEAPEVGTLSEGSPYTGNFSIVDLAYWLGRKTHDAVELQSSGFSMEMSVC
jgi:hypothetical protein